MVIPLNTPYSPLEKVGLPVIFKTEVSMTLTVILLFLFTIEPRRLLLQYVYEIQRTTYPEMLNPQVPINFQRVVN